MTKIILQRVLAGAAMMISMAGAAGQTIWPVNNDVTIGMYNGMGITTRYVETDKTGRLQFIMYGQDPSPGAPVGQLRPQRRVFGPSIVCGNAVDATCDVVASAVSIYAAQIADASSTGRSVLTASDGNAARMAIGAGTSNFDGTYAGLTGVPNTFAPSAHTHPASQISDASGLGRGLLTAVDAAAVRTLLSVPSAAELSANYYPLASNPAGYLTTVTSTQVTGALGFTPYNSTNPAGYLTSAAAASTYATQATVAGKFNTPTGSTAQYLRGDGSLATFPAIPTVPVINRTVATTAADGTYTWALPTACPAGQVPAVAVTPFNSTANEVINHKLTAVSNTSVSISLSRAVLTLNGLLGVTIPIIQTSPGAQVIHLIAVCP